VEVTREQLDAIRARVEAGTASGLSTQVENDRDGTTRWVNLGPYPCATHEDATQVRDIVTFVHAAPADLRALLAEVERLTDEGDAAFARGAAAMRAAAGVDVVLTKGAEFKAEHRKCRKEKRS
jgi:hypothetical protein